MNPTPLENRLARAAAIAAPHRSIVDDVMAGLPASTSLVARRSRWMIATVAAVGAGLAAAVAFVLTLVGPAAGLTFAEMRVAFEQQAWVHERHDAGQIRESWTNLRTGETWCARFDGGVVYINDATNVRQWYRARSGTIQQDTPTIYPAGQGPPPWTPRSAWEEIVGNLEQLAATIRPTGTGPGVQAVADVLDGRPMVRFDDWGTDSVGQRILYMQLWADRATHLPVRVRHHLQLAEREEAHKEWSTGTYDFPTTGPADLYALGVPRGTPVEVERAVGTSDVQPVLDAINRAHDGFLQHYLAVVTATNKYATTPIGAIDLIWRDGDRFRDNRYLPAPEPRNDSPPPPTEAAPSSPMVWAARHRVATQQLRGNATEYMWEAAGIRQRSAKPQVHATRKGRISLLASSDWPENVLWPTYDYTPNFDRLPADKETPPGCIGLRSGGAGNSRTDYYVDPANDHACVKQVQWERRKGAWVRSRQYELADLHRVDGHVVAGIQRMHDAGDADRGISENDVTLKIDLVPMKPSDYPPRTFDPKSLTDGAEVVGY